LGLELSKELKPGDATQKFFFEGNPLTELHKLSLMHGHEPFGWPFPNGYQDTANAWITMSAQVARWNLSRKFSYGSDAGSLREPDFAKLLPKSAKSPEQIVDAAATVFLGEKLPPDERAAALAIMKQVGAGAANSALRRKTEVAVGLILLKPEWNLR
jgi:hypothetical protein